MTPREVARLMARAIFCPNDPDGEPSFVETEKIVRGLAALREAGFVVLTEAEVAAREAAARREGIVAAARLIECGCDPAKRSAAVAAAPNSAARWNACGEPNCAAMDAAAIRALLAEPDADLARDFTTWTEGRSND